MRMQSCAHWFKVFKLSQLVDTTMVRKYWVINIEYLASFVMKHDALYIMEHLRFISELVKLQIYTNIQTILTIVEGHINNIKNITFMIYEQK